MNDLERYHDQVIEQSTANFEIPPESDSQTTSNLIAGVLRRWYIVLLVFFVMCAIGVPAIRLLNKPLHIVTGAIRVAPILANILTGEADKGEISNYQSFHIKLNQTKKEKSNISKIKLLQELQESPELLLIKKPDFI